MTSAYSAHSERWLWTAGAFAGSFLLFGLLYAQSPLLYDTDSYYHLTIGRALWQDGLDHDFPRLTHGLLAESFGDKEFLFHAYLAPFVGAWGPLTGGRIALALLNSLVLAAVGYLSLRAVGSWGVLIPLWLALTSMGFSWRMVRLRPELLALLFLIVGCWIASRYPTGSRARWLLLPSALFALSYTAIHAYVGIFLLVFLALGWVEKEWHWPIAIYPIAGAGLGLLVHPNFPNNLAVWWFQAFEFFKLKGTLDVGTEIQPVGIDVIALANLGWWLGIAILALTAGKLKFTETEMGFPEWRRAAWVFGIAALAFGGLFFLMSRFALYAFPLATLWLLFFLRSRELVPSRTIKLAGRSIPSVIAWSICVLVSIPILAQEIGRFNQRNDPGPDKARITQREAFAGAVPEGARVIAPWRQSPVYMLWAPQGRYLHVLDPGFLAWTDPVAYEAQRAIFSGAEPDVPMRALRDLESNFLAYPVATTSQRLAARLRADSRARTLSATGDVLVQFVVPVPSPFVTAWVRVPSDVADGADRDPWTASSDEIGRWPRLPSPDPPHLGGLAGYVEASDAGKCSRWLHVFDTKEPVEQIFELAPFGPSTLGFDGEDVAQVDGASHAVLGEGAIFQLALEAGEHRIVVETCRAGDSNQSGFYLLYRS